MPVIRYEYGPKMLGFKSLGNSYHRGYNALEELSISTVNRSPINMLRGMSMLIMGHVLSLHQGKT